MAKPRRNSSSLATWLVAGMLVAAAGGITWYSTASSPSPGQPADHETQTLAAASDPAESIDTAPAAAPSRVELGGLPTRVVVSSAGIDAAIDEVGVFATDSGPQWETAWGAAGHHIDSALPGEPGNVVLTGHVSVADSANVAVFAGLRDVEVGDVVEVFAGEARHRYEVTSVRVVDPALVAVLESDHQSRVTLITCTSDLEQRLIVTGSLIRDEGHRPTVRNAKADNIEAAS